MVRKKNMRETTSLLSITTVLSLMVNKVKITSMTTYSNREHILKCASTGVRVDWPSPSIIMMTATKHEFTWGIVSCIHIMLIYQSSQRYKS